MSKRLMRKHCAALIGIVAMLAAAPASAQDFYKGKTINILAGFSPGGGYDINARVLARHMGRHIPGNPTMVVQNMPGAGSLNAVHYLDNTAAKDGTVLNTFNFGAIGEARLSPDKIRIDFRKYNWIGSISQDLTVCYVWHALGVKTLDELKARPKVHYGSTGAGSSSDLNQRIMKNIFGVKLQQVGGYPGSAEQRIAIERGELDGDCGAWSSIPVEWIKEQEDQSGDPLVAGDRARHAAGRAVQHRHRAERARAADHAAAARLEPARAAVHGIGGGAGGAREDPARGLRGDDEGSEPSSRRRRSCGCRSRRSWARRRARWSTTSTRSRRTSSRRRRR